MPMRQATGRAWAGSVADYRNSTMQSRLLIEYMRTGWIAPLKKGDSKEVVETKLGAPEDWKGRVG